MFQILFTLVLLAVVIYGIVKKINIATVLFCVTVAGFTGLTFINGMSVAGGNTTGSRFIDIFEVIGATMSSAMGGYILTSIIMLSYMEYMNELKATDMLAITLASPIKKIKSKYLIAALAIPVGVLLGIAIAGSLITITLLLGTIYPVLRKLGCSRPTCATAVLLHTVVAISPVRMAYYNVLAIMGIEFSVPVWFIQIQLPVGGIMVLAIMILFIVTSMYFDKKEGISSEQEAGETEQKPVDQLGIPKYYAALPLIPLALVVVCSELVLKSVVISMVAASLLSWVIAFLVDLLSTRRLMECLRRFDSLYNGMSMITTSGIIVIFGTSFANALTAVGGMSTLVTMISKRASGGALLAVIGVAGLIMVALTGTFNGNLVLVFPFVREIIAVTNINALGAAQAIMFSLTSGAGVCVVSGQNLFLARQTDTDIITIIKRAAIPTLGGWITSFAVCLIFYG